MIDLDWFEQFSNFNSFQIAASCEDVEVLNFKKLKPAFLFVAFDFPDAFVFIRDFVNVQYSVTRFDFFTNQNCLTICIAVDAV